MTFFSIDDLLNAQGHFPRSRFVEYFSGKGGTNIPSAIWAFTNTTGSGTGVMNDVINEGFSVNTSAIASGDTHIDNGDIRWISPTSHIFICEQKRVSTNASVHSGCMESTTTLTNSFAFSVITDDTSGSFKALDTSDGSSSNSFLNSTISINTSWSTVRFDLQSSSVPFYINGTLEGTKTDLLPDQKMQQLCRTFNRSTTASEGRFRYLECYNK